MSIAQNPARVTSIREWATQAYERQQAEIAEQKRQEIKAAAERFTSEVRRSLRGFTVTHDPFSPIVKADVESADIELVETADGFPFEATVVFAGERFRYAPTPNCGGEALYHVWTCPVCGDQQESTQSIRSLAGLGYWLAEAPQRCYHGGAL